FLGVWWEYWLAWCKSREKARERKLLEKKLQEEEKGNPRGATLITQTIMDLKERGPASARRIPKEPSPRDMDFAEPLAPIAPKKSQVEKAPPLTIGTYDFVFPSINMLRPPVSQRAVDENELLQRATQLTEKGKELDVHGEVHHIHPGPVVTTYEFKPEAGVKYSKITNLVDDLCLALKAESVRIDRLPGKSTVGVEVP